MKKVALFLLAAQVLLFAFIGCGKGKSQSAAGDGDHMTISLAEWDIDTVMEAKDTDKLFKYICDKFNVTIEPVNITWNDYREKIQSWAATGGLPDIFCTDIVGSAAYYSWTEQGVVRPMLPIDAAKYPNLAKYFETPDIAAMANENGEYFAVPRRMYPTTDWSALDRVVAYRWDLAQEAGITKEPETWDELKAMLKAIIDNDPEKRGIVGITTTQKHMNSGFFWLYSNPVATSDGSGSDFKWVKENGKYVPAIFTDKSLPALNNMREMYQNGLVDSDWATTTLQAAYDKFGAGKCAAIVIGGGFGNLNNAIYNQRWKVSYPDKNFTDCVKVLKPLKNANGDLAHAIFKTYWSESYFSANVDDAKMERIMQIYDWLLSDEAAQLFTYGFEGEDFERDGDNIKILVDSTERGEKYKAGNGVFGSLATYNTQRVYDINNPTISNMEIRQAAVDYVDWILQNTTLPEYYPEITMLKTPTKAQFSILDGDDLLAIMMGTKPVEQMWKEIVAGYEAKGLSKMIEEVNEAMK